MANSALRLFSFRCLRYIQMEVSEASAGLPACSFISADITHSAALQRQGEDDLLPGSPRHLAHYQKALPHLQKHSQGMKHN